MKGDLGTRADRLWPRENEVFYSPANLWEIAIKSALRRGDSLSHLEARSK